LYLQPDEWSRKAVLNSLNMGTFSSDRSIREYAQRIWRIKPVLADPQYGTQPFIKGDVL
jgi:glycogen phosphorylase